MFPCERYVGYGDSEPMMKESAHIRNLSFNKPLLFQKEFHPAPYPLSKVTPISVKSDLYGISAQNYRSWLKYFS